MGGCGSGRGDDIVSADVVSVVVAVVVGLDDDDNDDDAAPLAVVVVVDDDDDDGVLFPMVNLNGAAEPPVLLPKTKLPDFALFTSPKPVDDVVDCPKMDVLLDDPKRGLDGGGAVVVVAVVSLVVAASLVNPKNPV